MAQINDADGAVLPAVSAADFAAGWKTCLARRHGGGPVSSVMGIHCRRAWSNFAHLSVVVVDDFGAGNGAVLAYPDLPHVGLGERITRWRRADLIFSSRKPFIGKWPFRYGLRWYASQAMIPVAVALGCLVPSLTNCRMAQSTVRTFFAAD